MFVGGYSWGKINLYRFSNINSFSILQLKSDFVYTDVALLFHISDYNNF